MPRNKAESHERIVAAAKDEFLTYGFENASMRRIAANAGITASGLYKHFPNKEEGFPPSSPYHFRAMLWK